MSDIVPEYVRSRMMAGIRGKDTKPERVIRRILHSSGYRYRLHVKDLPGAPDIVLPKYRAAIFVHGCFWHGHDCRLFKWPHSRSEFWKQKISSNQHRDKTTLDQLLGNGWRIGIVWECAMRGSSKLDSMLMAAQLLDWVASRETSIEIQGKKTE